ncbi:MAG TPA: hypothetical protein VF170_10005 [Planctomycetaceae bacterium]
MSYDTREPLEQIIRELKAKLPGLKKLLHDGVEVHTLHGTVEMISSLVARYERGEIVEKK